MARNYDETYLDGLIAKAKKSWEGVDVESYMSGLRDNDMKTIEERAKANLAYEQDFCGHSLSENMVCRAYVRGATEQKAIDDAECVNKVLMGKGSSINYYKQGYHDAIEHACEWLGPHLAEVADLYDSTAGLLLRLVKENFRIAMEKKL